MSESDFLQSLQETTGVVDSKRICTLSTAYKEHLSDIRRRLEELGVQGPTATDTLASLMCRLTSTEVERLGEAECVVKLKTTSDKDIQFACSLPQLEDLVWTLRQASKVVEHHAQ